MQYTLLQSLIPAIISIVSILIGNKIQFNKKHKYMLTNVAVGSLLAIMSIELIPMIHSSPLLLHKGLTILGIILAVFLLNILKKYNDDKKKQLYNIRNALFKYIPLCIGLFLDGLIIGIQQNTGLGVILAIALSLDNFFLGLSIGNNIGNHVKLLIITAFSAGLSVLLGTIAGIYLLKNFKNSVFLYFILSFGITTLMWEIFQELIPISNILKKEIKDDKLYNLYGMYIGFVIVFILNWIQ